MSKKMACNLRHSAHEEALLILWFPIRDCLASHRYTSSWPTRHCHHWPVVMQTQALLCTHRKHPGPQKNPSSVKVVSGSDHLVPGSPACGMSIFSHLIHDGDYAPPPIFSKHSSKLRQSHLQDQKDIIRIHFLFTFFAMSPYHRQFAL